MPLLTLAGIVTSRGSLETPGPWPPVEERETHNEGEKVSSGGRGRPKYLSKVMSWFHFSMKQPDGTIMLLCNPVN